MLGSAWARRVAPLAALALAIGAAVACGSVGEAPLVHGNTGGRTDAGGAVGQGGESPASGGAETGGDRPTGGAPDTGGGPPSKGGASSNGGTGNAGGAGGDFPTGGALGGDSSGGAASGGDTATGGAPPNTGGAPTPPGECAGDTPHGCYIPKADNPRACPPQIHEQSAFYPPPSEWEACSVPGGSCVYEKPGGGDANCRCIVTNWLCEY
jgi:hypothetical protein